MPDRLSLMLDSMILAVDNGLSYDGIVSVPEIGLEDFGHRPGLAGWLDSGMELFWKTVFRMKNRIFPFGRKNRGSNNQIVITPAGNGGDGDDPSSLKPAPPSPPDNPSSPGSSGPVLEKPPAMPKPPALEKPQAAQPPAPQLGGSAQESSASSQASHTDEQTPPEGPPQPDLLGDTYRLPRRKGPPHTSPLAEADSPRDDMTPPRDPRKRVKQSIPRLPRVKEKQADKNQVASQQSLPQESGPVLGSITHPDVGQSSSSTPEGDVAGDTTRVDRELTSQSVAGPPSPGR